ncbi:hypothetical protein BC835DRAFT_1325923 [Cytidiella melzeri]|nr:hypothetical protein BC835DRAFT_1325923 [Cytidiella melzeri]
MQLCHGMYIRHFLLSLRSRGVEELLEFLFVHFTDFADFAVSECFPFLYDDKFAKSPLVVSTFSGVLLTYARAMIEGRVRDAHEAWDKRGVIVVIEVRLLELPYTLRAVQSNNEHREVSKPRTWTVTQESAAGNIRGIDGRRSLQAFDQPQWAAEC